MSQPLVDSAFHAQNTTLAAMVHHFDWSTTPLNSRTTWAPSLRTAVNICLASNFPMIIFWGPEYIQIYNDAYAPILGAKHPSALGQSAKQCWAEIWTDIAPLLHTVHTTGEAVFVGDTLYCIDRFGFVEEAYFTFSYTPIQDESGQVGGVLEPVTETTTRVLSERRMGVLRDLAAHVNLLQGESTAIQGLMDTLQAHSADIPLALLYLLENPSRQVQLQSTCGLVALSSSLPTSIELTATDALSCTVATAIADGKVMLLADADSIWEDLPGGPWPERTHQLLILPLLIPGQAEPLGVLVVGISPRLHLDTAYRDFLHLAAGQVAIAIASARSYIAEKQRAETLAELDRAKTTFFNNISHEFRTPLTLMIGPVADSLADHQVPLPSAHRERLEIVQRNATRLLKLVNTLLDFSRLEAGRMQAAFQPTDLAEFARTLTSHFASAATQANLELIITCPTLKESVYVDQRLWEQVVVNLIANAFKYTPQGQITIALSEEADAAIFMVQDTGVGIPPEALPHLFERFYRVPETTGRTHEGTGIGLALVHELVKLHGGTISVASTVGQGSCFTVRLPFGLAHLPAEQIHGTSSDPLFSSQLTAALTEVMHWQPATPFSRSYGIPSDVPRILLVEDNPDMREYLCQLLQHHYQIQVAFNGKVALDALRTQLPDLIMSDVMMPELDGFGLLKHVRANPMTCTIPFILLSARAGEEATIEGLDAGADDYLIKPFSARELLSRVASHIELIHLRREEASLRETNRRMTEFLHIASHELRTPLNAMQGNVQLVQDLICDMLQEPASSIERSQMEMIHEWLSDAESGTKRLTHLVKDMLDITGLDGDQWQMELTLADILVLIPETVTQIQESWPERAIILSMPPEQRLMVTMDKERIEQVLANYLSNALKYSPCEAPILVTVEIEPEAVRVAVQDQGPGVPEEKQQRIWERFYRVDGIATKNRAEVGLGLGLYFNRIIIAQHGGEVGLASQMGQGATFWFRLPTLTSSDDQAH